MNHQIRKAFPFQYRVEIGFPWQYVVQDIYGTTPGQPVDIGINYIRSHFLWGIYLMYLHVSRLVQDFLHEITLQGTIIYPTLEKRKLIFKSALGSGIC